MKIHDLHEEPVELTIEEQEKIVGGWSSAYSWLKAWNTPPSAQAAGWQDSLADGVQDGIKSASN
jgi:hypothetical protein